MKQKTFKVNLKLKWVVGLVVVLSLGMGEFPTRSYIALMKEKFNKFRHNRSCAAGRTLRARLC